MLPEQTSRLYNSFYDLSEMKTQQMLVNSIFRTGFKMELKTTFKRLILMTMGMAVKDT